MNKTKQLLVALTTLLLLVLSAVLLAGQVLIHPVQRTIGNAPAALGAESVTVNAATGPVSGWLVDGQADKGSVILLHGVRSDRRQMLPRAFWLKQLGYSVLLIDLPAHGESPGKHITFGANESKAVEAAIDFMANRHPGNPIGIIGVSLGAASTALANSDHPLDAVVLESMYPTIEDAVRNRLAIRLGHAGTTLAPLLLRQLPLRLDITPDALRPIDHLAHRGFPLLIASGDIDPRTPIDEACRLYQAAGEPKRFWAVSGASHVDLFDYDRSTYEQIVGAFLAEHMQHQTEAPRAKPSIHDNR